MNICFTFQLNTAENRHRRSLKGDISSLSLHAHAAERSWEDCDAGENDPNRKNRFTETWRASEGERGRVQKNSLPETSWVKSTLIRPSSKLSKLVLGSGLHVLVQYCSEDNN